MTYSIIEKLNTTTDTTTGDLSPVYIGLAKRKITIPVPTITNNTFTLVTDPNYILDSQTIVIDLFYWKALNEATSITIASSTNILTTSFTPIYPIIPGDLFTIKDVSSNLTFSSAITNIVFSGDTITSLTISDTLTPGTYSFTIIRKLNEFINFEYDITTGLVTLLYPGIYTANNFASVDYVNSYVQYNGSYNNYASYILNTITDVQNNNNLQNFAYNELGYVVNNHFGLSSSKCAVITIPNINYLQEMLDDLEINYYGYMLVPIYEDDNFISKLFSYVLSTNKFHSLIISNLTIENTYSVSNIGNDPTQYVDPGYVDIGYVY